MRRVCYFCDGLHLGMTKEYCLFDGLKLRKRMKCCLREGFETKNETLRSLCEGLY